MKSAQAYQGPGQNIWFMRTTMCIRTKFLRSLVNVWISWREIEIFVFICKAPKIYVHLFSVNRVVIFCKHFTLQCYNHIHWYDIVYLFIMLWMIVSLLGLKYLYISNNHALSVGRVHVLPLTKLQTNIVLTFIAGSPSPASLTPCSTCTSYSVTRSFHTMTCFVTIRTIGSIYAIYKMSYQTILTKVRSFKQMHA